MNAKHIAKSKSKGQSHAEMTVDALERGYNATKRTLRPVVKTSSIGLRCVAAYVSGFARTIVGK